MSKPLTARLVKWDSERGFGFLAVDGQEVFLHIRDFSERHKIPEVGDSIRFSPGTDARGRICALNAVHVNDGGKFTREIFLFLILLLLAPVPALYKLGFDWRWSFGTAFGFSVITYLVYSRDKMCARAHQWRISEATLQFLALAGGWPGAFIAQWRLRHKCSKLRFQITFWMIVSGYQFVAVDYLLNWRLSREILVLGKQWLHR